MQRMRFEGHSDDTFGEYSLINEDYDNCASGGVIAWKVTERTSIYSDDDVSGMIVCGQHGSDGWPADMEATWLIGIQPLEDLPLPDWVMRFNREDYRTRLEIDAPDGVAVHIECLNRR